MHEIMLFITVICVVGFGFLVVAKRPFDAMGFFLCFVAYRHLPSIFYLFGFSGESAFFDNVRHSSAMVEMALIFMVFMVFTYLGYLVFNRVRFGQSLFPDYSAPKSDLLILAGIITLTICAFIVAWIPIQQTGDIFEAINLVRNLDFYEGLNVLKKFIQFATLLSSAYIVDLIVRKRRGAHIDTKFIGLIAALFILNLFFSFIMGGKGFIIWPLAFMAISYAVCATKKPMQFISLTCLALVVLVLSLQFTRIIFVKEASIKDPISYLYGALHFDVMDGNLIFIDTLGTLHDEETGETFANGLAGVVPRFLWPDKPVQITAGGDFKESLLPRSRGGWPVFAYNQWFSSFGWLGVITGGFLTGWLLRQIQTKYSQMTHDPFSTYIAYILILYVVSPTGINNGIFINYIFFVIPLFIFQFLTQARWGRLLTPTVRNEV